MSSKSRGIQDMLVPSIETTSGNISARSTERADTSNRLENISPVRPVLESRGQLPAQRQVIVIDDDSPQAKRRRVFPEDDAGRLRLISSHDQDRYAQHQERHSSLLPIQPGNFPLQRSGATNLDGEGLYKTASTQWDTSLGDERLPVYDAPESGVFAIHPRLSGRSDVGYGSVPGGVSRIPDNMGSAQRTRDITYDYSHHPRPVNDYERGPVRMAERERFPELRPLNHPGDGDRVQRPLSPKFPVQSRVSRSYGTVPVSAPADDDFVHTFSQSRLEGISSRPSGAFPISRERSQPSAASQFNHPRTHELRPVSAFAPAPPARARSPMDYAQRSL